MAVKAYAAKLELDLIKQAMCFQKLDEIMDKLYSHIKGTPLFKRILNNLKEAAKKFLYAREKPITKEKVKAFKLSMNALYESVEELDKVQLENDIAKDVKLAFCNVNNTQFCNLGAELDVDSLKCFQTKMFSDKVTSGAKSAESEPYGASDSSHCSTDYSRSRSKPLATWQTAIYTSDLAKSDSRPLVRYQMKPGSVYKPKICDLSNGLDLPLQEEVILLPNELKKVDLGIKLLIPKNYCAFLMGKSSARVKYYIQVYLGLIDVGYRDYLQVVIQNMSMEKVVLGKGIAICQFLLIKSKIPSFELGWEELEDRGGSFGSTGQNFEKIPSESENFLVEENRNYFLEIQSTLDSLDPQNINVGDLRINLLNYKADKFEQTSDLLDFEYSQMKGSSVNTMAMLPNLPTNTLEPLSTEEEQFVPTDPDNFRDKNGKMPDLNPREMSALLASDFADNYKLSTETLAELQNAEYRLRNIKDHLVGNPENYKNFVLKNGILCRQFTVEKAGTQFLGVYIPTSLLYAVVIYVHKHFLHPSKTQTLKEFQSLYYHPFAKRAVQKVCDSCVICTQSRNPIKSDRPVGRERTLKPMKPRESISMDVLYLPASSKGYKYGLIISDLYSLYISFYPMKTKSSAEIARNLRSYFAAHCPPMAVYSDSDPCFRGEVENLFRLYKVQHLTSYPFTQRENYVESQVRTFKNAYRAAIIDSPVFKTRDWDTLYPLVVCRINCMISKYGMSREAMHYGDIVESSLPLITDAEVYQPLEADLERVQTMFRDRMGRFMQKRSRNKLHYKIGKEKKFYINELVMYKVYKPESMLHPTYTGPARIIDLGAKGATLRDPKTGATFSVSFENLRKINFEELLTLLPQNFDAEIADTLGTYRYRRALADPEQAPETVQIGSDPEPESEPEPDLIPVPEPIPDPTETTAGP
jgi:dUTPase